MRLKEFFDCVGDWSDALTWLLIHLVMLGFLALAVALVINQLFFA